MNRILKLLFFGVGAFILILVGIFYFYLCPRLNPGLVESIMFHPERRAEHYKELKTLAGVTAEEVNFKVGESGPLLNALFYKVPGSDSIVLFSHGNAGMLDERIDKYQAIIDSGVSVFAFDYRGYGKSEDVHPTLKGVIEDSVAAYDYIKSKLGFKPKQIILYGESIGTGITTELARMRKSKGIILESGFASPEKWAKDRLPLMQIYPSFLFIEPALDNVDYVTGKHPPLLIFAGEKDEVIPCENSQLVFEKATEPKQLVLAPNSSHNDFTKDFPLYRKRLMSFLQSLDSDKEDSPPDNHAVPTIPTKG